MTTFKITIQTMMSINNNKGAVLIAVYMAMFVLVTLASSISLFNFTELNESRRYADSTAAFWLAEAGINLFLADTTMLDQTEMATFEEERGFINIVKDDSNRKFRLVTSTGIVGGSRRAVQIKYPALSMIFENTMSTKGDILIEGQKSSLLINDKIRFGGNVINTSDHPFVYFEDSEEGVDEALVSITYPDVDGNGTPDEFSDFVQYYRELIASYPEDEVVYIKGNDTYTITPDESLSGTKIVFIEGQHEGEGNAIIQFTGALEKDESLTVIATGTVMHNQAGIAKKGSQLNIIAWSDYFETTALPSVHNGMIYTHGTAYFDEMHDTSVTNGSVVANEGIVIREVWSTKTFNYADIRKKGVVPPGFEGLAGGRTSGYTQKPSTWREI